VTRAQDLIEARHSELSAELSSSFDTQVAVIGWREGFDHHADLALAPGQWTRVVLSPRVEELNTSYEGSVDFGEVINRQALAYAAASSAGVPVPSVYLARHRRESQCGRSLLLLEQVPDDESWSARSDYQLGGLVRQLHAIPGWVIDGGPGDPVGWRDVVSARLTQRLSAAQCHLGLSDLPDVKRILDAELAESPEHPLDCLLHMDIRRPNICVSDQHIGGLIDFANVIRGDPLFELARIRYSGLLSNDFLRGYGIEDPAAWSRKNASLLALYEIDIAALLVTVAIEEADTPDLFTQASTRLRELIKIVRYALDE
jgi:Phosphotransferase enzyme family